MWVKTSLLKKQLLSGEKAELNEAVRSHPCYAKRKRAHAILLANRNYTIDQLSSLFACEASTIENWIDTYQNYGLEGLMK